MAVKIKKDHQVRVMKGVDKGMTGRVLRIVEKRDPRGRLHRYCLVEGARLKTHYKKANPQMNEEGSIEKKEGLIDCSNVCLIHPKTGKPGRIGFVIKDGKKKRIFKSDGVLVGESGT